MFEPKWRTRRMAKELASIRALLPFARRHPVAVTVIVVLGIIEVLAEGIGITLFIPLLYSAHGEQSGFDSDDWLGQMLDKLFTVLPADNRLLIIALAILGLILLKGVLAYSGRLAFAWLDVRMNERICGDACDRLLAMPLQTLGRKSVGQWHNLLDSETYATSEAVANALTVAVHLVAITLFTALLLLISWRLTVFAGASLLLISLLVRLFTKRVAGLSRAGLRADEIFSQRTIELLSGMRTIRLFTRESHQWQRFMEAARRSNRINFKLEAVSALIEPASETLAAMALLLLVLFFSLQSPDNLPTALILLFILFRLQPQISGLDEARTELAAASAPIKSLTDFLAGPTATDAAGTIRFEALRQGIRFDSVGFRYSAADPLALQDFSASIEQGRVTAIVGPSGSGKSTLINLLARFHQPQSGAIYVDGQELSQIELGSWRERLAVVGQNDFLFDTTVKQNIAYGRLGSSDEDIVQAAQRAAADEFIRALPRGYETRVGDRGARLSEGQKQRICIARALLRKPTLLILDEATNALDSLSERTIQSVLHHHDPQLTVILIAHRMASIELADNILVLDSGRLVEQGDLATLTNNRALFTRLRELQTHGTPALQDAQSVNERKGERA